MRNKWIDFGCFLTGYNKHIIAGCSESSRRRVIRYTSAMILVAILWAFIGYSFTGRYLRGNVFLSILGSLLMVFMVVQIERQVILASKANRAPIFFRGVIAVIMAIIGSLIIDQIVFAEDVEQQKIIAVGSKVEGVFRQRAGELRRQIAGLDSIILKKENERRAVEDDISKHPTITTYITELTQHPGDSIPGRTLRASQILNPKGNLIKPFDEQLSSLRNEKVKKEQSMLDLRSVVEQDLLKRNGFLDELELMKSILMDSGTAFFVWLLWFTLLLGLELFILVSTLQESVTDYDAIVEKQLDLHFKRIDLLSRQ